MSDPTSPSQTTSQDAADQPLPDSAQTPEPAGADQEPSSAPEILTSSSSQESETKSVSTPEPEGLSDEVEEKELGGRMTFLEHLDELRRRILYSLASVLLTFVGAWTFREEIYTFLAAPIRDVVDRLVVITPTEPFTIYLKVSFTGAIFAASPWILAQIWLFIAPGLYRREKRFALPFLLSSTVLFLLGGAFSYYIVLPPALRFLLLEFGRNFQPMITAMEFFDFALLIIVGMGAVFQLPVLVAFLSIFGLVTPRFLWKNFRYAFLIIVIIAAVVSPTTDPFNLFLWTGPMVILYTVSIGVSWIFKRRRERLEER